MNKLPVVQKAKLVNRPSNLGVWLLGLPMVLVLLLVEIGVLPDNSMAWAEEITSAEAGENRSDPLRNTGWPVLSEPLQTSCMQRSGAFKTAPALPDLQTKEQLARIDALVANLSATDLKRGPISNGTINLFARIDNAGQLQGGWFYRAPRPAADDANNHRGRQTANLAASSIPTYQPYGSQNLVIEVPDSALVGLSLRGRQQAALPSAKNALGSQSFAALTAWTLGFHYGADAVTRANTYGNQTLNSQIRAGFAGLASQPAPGENQIPRLVIDVVDPVFSAQDGNSSQDGKSLTSPYLLVFSKVNGPDSLQVGKWQNYQWHRQWDSRYGDRSYLPLQNRDYQPDWLFSAPGLYELQNAWIVPNTKAAQLGRQAVDLPGNIYFVVGDAMIAHLRQAYSARQTAESKTLPPVSPAYPQIGSGRWCVEYPSGARLSTSELSGLFLQCQNSGFCSFSSEFLKGYLPGFGANNSGNSANGNSSGNTGNGNPGNSGSANGSVGSGNSAHPGNSGGAGNSAGTGNIGNPNGTHNGYPGYHGALPIQPLPSAQMVPGSKPLVNNRHSALAPLIKSFTPLGPLRTNPFADGTGTQAGGSSVSAAQLISAAGNGLMGSSVAGKLGANGNSLPGQQGKSSLSASAAPGSSGDPNPVASTATGREAETGAGKGPAENSGNLDAAGLSATGERVLSEVDYQPAGFFTEDRLAGMLIGFGSALLLVGAAILGISIYRLQVARKTK